MNVRKAIPNTITSMNLLCGVVGVIFAFKDRPDIAFVMMLAAAVFDFLDGLAARALGAYSDIGKELDSLCDVVSFGVLPALMLHRTMVSLSGETVWSYIPLLLAVFSALRLAKFNIDERQTSSFIGLATPANAIFWGALIAAFPEMASWAAWMPWAMLAVAAVSCWLLISELPMFSLKFKDMSWANNKVRYIFLIGCVLIVALCCIMAALRSNYHYALFSGTGVILWYVIANLCTPRK